MPSKSLLSEIQTAFLEAAKHGTVADAEKCLSSVVSSAESSSSSSSTIIDFINSCIDPLTGNTALHFSCTRGSLQITRYLMKQYSDHDGEKNKQNTQQQQQLTKIETSPPTASAQPSSSLATTTTTPTIAVAKKTLKDFINTTNNTGETALTFAVQNSHYHVVKELLDHGADASNNNGDNSPLHRSALFDAVTSVHITKLLIEQGKCDVNQRDKYGNTALHFAAVKDKTGDVVQILVDKTNTDDDVVEIENSLHQTPMAIALAQKNAPVLEVLQRHLSTSQLKRNGTSPQRSPGLSAIQLETNSPSQRTNSQHQHHQQAKPLFLNDDPSRLSTNLSISSRFESENNSLASCPSDVMQQQQHQQHLKSGFYPHQNHHQQLQSNISVHQFDDAITHHQHEPPLQERLDGGDLGIEFEEDENHDDDDGDGGDFGRGLQHEEVVCFE